MAMKLKPGYLVNLSVRIDGGVNYKKIDLGTSREGEREDAEWRTHRQTANVNEHAGAVEARGKARALIVGACVQTPFVTMCLTDGFPLFQERIVEARQIVAAFNSEAKHSQIYLHCSWAQVAESSREWADSFRSDLGKLLGELKEAAESQDVKRMKDLASRVNSAGKMLDDSAHSATLSKAVEAARAMAKATAKAIADGAERLEDDLAAMNLAPIQSAWFEFIGGAAVTAEPAIDPQATIFDVLAVDEDELPAELPEVAACGNVNGWNTCSLPAGHPGAHVESDAGAGPVGWFNEDAAPLDVLADLSAPPESDPYAEGWEAAAANKAEESNPYADGSEEFSLWSNGWADSTIEGDPSLKSYMEA